MMGTFIDTIIVCTMTGLAIIVTGVWNSGETGAALTASAFAAAFPGGDYFLAIALAVFAFTTILGWAYYGEKCWEYPGRLRGRNALPGALDDLRLDRRGDPARLRLAGGRHA